VAKKQSTAGPSEQWFREQTNVILEQMNSQFTLVLESHHGLREEIRQLRERTDERFGLVDAKIEGLKVGQDALRHDVEGLKAGQEGLKAGQDALRHDVGELKVGLKAVREDLAAHRADTEVHHRGRRAAG